MTVTAGVAAVKGTYAGTVELADLVAPESLVLKAAGAGAPGTIGADVAVRLSATGDGRTRIDALAQLHRLASQASLRGLASASAPRMDWGGGDDRYEHVVALVRA